MEWQPIESAPAVDTLTDEPPLLLWIKELGEPAFGQVYESYGLRHIRIFSHNGFTASHWMRIEPPKD